MLSSIGQSITLASHARAALAGFDVSLNLTDNPWFAGIGSLSFCIGDNRAQVIARNVREWLGGLRPNAFVSAYLWFESPTGYGLSEIQALAFDGTVRWAPVTRAADYEVIWHELPSADATQRLRGGFRVMPGQQSLMSSPDEARSQLIPVLKKMAVFQAKYRPQEPFGDMFHRGIAIVEGRERWQDRVDLLFPADVFPEESYRLAGAVHAAWAIGGMGWWNDWSCPDPDVQGDFQDLTKEYYRAMGMALYAACSAPLDSEH